MTDLRIDIAAFKEACADARESWDFFSDEERDNWLDIQGSYRGWLRSEIADRRDDFLIPATEAAPAEVEPRSFESIKAELGTAATAAGGYGATRAQVTLLATLAWQADETGPILSGGHLTREQASILIEEYKRHA